MSNFDMAVDTAVFDDVNNTLSKCRSKLLESSDELLRFVDTAGQSLKGRQYALSVQETNATCTIVTASADNIELIKEHLVLLKEIVEEYLGCIYEEYE